MAASFIRRSLVTLLCALYRGKAAPKRSEGLTRSRKREEEASDSNQLSYTWHALLHDPWGCYCRDLGENRQL
jgi:hypothetical protein